MWLTKTSVGSGVCRSKQLAVVGYPTLGKTLMPTHRSSLPQRELGILQEFPCVDCGDVVPVHLLQSRTQDKIPVLCDPCIGIRVAAVIAAVRGWLTARLVMRLPGRSRSCNKAVWHCTSRPRGERSVLLPLSRVYCMTVDTNESLMRSRWELIMVGEARRMCPCSKEKILVSPLGEAPSEMIDHSLFHCTLLNSCSGSHHFVEPLFFSPK
jgi:hypothetical protein